MTFRDYLHTQNRCLNWREREDYAPSLRLMARVPEGRGWALEIGSCRGMEAVQLAAKGYRVFGIDLFPGLLREAKPGPSYAVADMHAIPVGARAVRLVYANNGIEHAHDVRCALAEIARVLVPGGRFCGALPLRAAWWSEAHLWSVDTPEELRAVFAAMCPTLRLEWMEFMEDTEPQCLFVLMKAG